MAPEKTSCCSVEWQCIAEHKYHGPPLHLFPIFSSIILTIEQETAQQTPSSSRRHKRTSPNQKIRSQKTTSLKIYGQKKYMATEEMSLHAAAASTSTSSIEILLTDQHMMQYTMGLSDPHDVPAKDLYEKLSFLKQQQQQRKMNIKPAHSLEESHHNSLHRQHQHQHHHCDLSIDTSNTVTSKCSSQDTLMEILQQIDHRHLQKDLEKENELELEEAATLRRHRRYKLNPDLLKDHPFTLKQNHGLANLRHS